MESESDRTVPSDTKIVTDVFSLNISAEMKYNSITHKKYACIQICIDAFKETLVQFVLASDTIVLSDSPSTGVHVMAEIRNHVHTMPVTLNMVFSPMSTFTVDENSIFLQLFKW